MTATAQITSTSECYAFIRFSLRKRLSLIPYSKRYVAVTALVNHEQFVFKQLENNMFSQRSSLCNPRSLILLDQQNSAKLSQNKIIDNRFS